MTTTGSKRERIKHLFNSDKSNKEAVSWAGCIRQLQSSANSPEPILTQHRPIDAGLERDEYPNAQTGQEVLTLAESVSTWNLATESLKQKRPDLYRDLQDLHDHNGARIGSKSARRVQESSNDTHAQTQTNVEKILQSFLIYKDVAMAVSRLDPHGIAPLVVTGVCVVVHAASNGLKNVEEATAAAEKFAALVARWTNRDERSFSHQDITLKDKFTELIRSMVDLYVAILECQISLARYCDASIFERVIGAAYSLDLLRSQLTTIKEKDDTCKTYLTILTAGNGTVKIYICSRTDLRSRAEHYFPEACFLEVATEKTQSDTDNHIRREVQDRETHLRLLDGRHSDLEVMFTDMLCQRAGGMRRSFKHPEDIKDRTKRPEKVSVAGRAELNKTYSEIFDRHGPCETRDRGYAQDAESLVLHAFQIMTFEDLAMTIKCYCVEEEGDDDLDDEIITPAYVNVITRDFLIQSTSQVVEFAHVSVKEYLQDPDEGAQSEYSAKKCHGLIAYACLGYLLRKEKILGSMEDVKMELCRLTNEEENSNRESDSDEDDEYNTLKYDLRFKPYAKCYWPAQVKFFDDHMPDRPKMKFSKFILPVLEPSSAYERWASDVRSTDPNGISYTLGIDEDLEVGWKMDQAVSLPTSPVAASCAFGFLFMIDSLTALSSFDWD